jgi:hypothetical protein
MKSLPFASIKSVGDKQIIEPARLVFLGSASLATRSSATNFSLSSRPAFHISIGTGTKAMSKLTSPKPRRSKTAVLSEAQLRIGGANETS